MPQDLNNIKLGLVCQDMEKDPLNEFRKAYLVHLINWFMKFKNK